MDVELGELKFRGGSDEVIFNVCNSMNPLNKCRVLSVIDIRDELVEVPYEEVKPPDPC